MPKPKPPQLPIPISAAAAIAETYHYDQVVVVARRVGDGGGEHVTTYGRNRLHCGIAARCGAALKAMMGWYGGAPDAERAHGARRAPLYYEARVVITYIEGARLQAFENRCSAHGFRADGLALTRGVAKEDRVRSATTYGLMFDDIHRRTMAMVAGCVVDGFSVQRYAIKDVVVSWPPPAGPVARL